MYYLLLFGVTSEHHSTCVLSYRCLVFETPISYWALILSPSYGSLVEINVEGVVVGTGIVVVEFLRQDGDLPGGVHGIGI